MGGGISSPICFFAGSNSGTDAVFVVRFCSLGVSTSTKFKLGGIRKFRDGQKRNYYLGADIVSIHVHSWFSFLDHGPQPTSGLHTFSKE